MIKDYTKNYNDLIKSMAELESKLPETMKGFNALNKASISEGKLELKIKELIALGIAIAVPCDGYIAFQVHDALKAGITSQGII